LVIEEWILWGSLGGKEFTRGQGNTVYLLAIRREGNVLSGFNRGWDYMNSFSQC
jgi:hypothetical protein